MASMKQNPRTDYGTKGETGEKEPKGVKASDEGGEKKKGIVAGVAMGKADATGRSDVGSKERGQYNEGRQADGAVCYSHKRIPHAQDS